MTTGKLIKGPIYAMMVVNIEQKRSFKKGDTAMYVHHITFMDQAGVQYVGEYTIESPTQNVFVKGVKSPDFKVTLEGRYGNEINLADFVYKPKPEPTPAPPPGSNAVLPMNGQSYTFAIGYAKDLMIPLLRGGESLDEDFTAKLFSLADEINQWMIDKQREQQFNHI